MTKVPNLATPLSEPLHQLEEVILSKQVSIECWLRQQWQKTPAPIYSSVDLRNSGFKIAPVDTNLFSAGFNNLNSELLPLCKQAMQATLRQQFPQVEKILLIPENHTRNTAYLENLATLFDIIECAGYHVKLGSVATEIALPAKLTTASGREITLHPVSKQNNKLVSEDFIADLIFLNNDLSEGNPELLQNLTQPIVPNPCLGWEHRLKSDHFKHYNAVAEEFSQLINIDPWLINPFFRRCAKVDFMTGAGMDCAQKHAEELFSLIKQKYTDYKITTEPFLIVKADAGSYGMGVMSVKSSDELAHLNRKQRSHMAKTKGKVAITKVILQEGVPTIEKWDQHVAEPVVYMVGENVVGGFYRVNTERSDSENLNSPGMRFESLAFASSCQAPGKTAAAKASQCRFYVYGVIARLAALASAREIAAIKSGDCQ